MAIIYLVNYLASLEYSKSMLSFTTQNSKGIFHILNAYKLINTEKNKLIESYVILYSERNLIKSPSFVAIANLG